MTSTRAHIGHRGRQAIGTIDVTRYVFCCLACPWQLQAGYRARSDLGGAEALHEAIARAGMQHNAEAHAADDTTPVLVDEEGDRHESTGRTQGALMAQRLPDWWVDRG